MKINVKRPTVEVKRGNRVDPTAVRQPRKGMPNVCLACASRSSVATHTCGITA